jgi:hypothetical protein
MVNSAAAWSGYNGEIDPPRSREWLTAKTF